MSHQALQQQQPSNIGVTYARTKREEESCFMLPVNDDFRCMSWSPQMNKLRSAAPLHDIDFFFQLGTQVKREDPVR